MFFFRPGKSVTPCRFWIFTIGKKYCFLRFKISQNELRVGQNRFSGFAFYTRQERLCLLILQHFFQFLKVYVGYAFLTAGKKINDKKICSEILQFNIGENIMLVDVIFSQ